MSRLQINRNPILLPVALVFILSQTACLKTRAQVKEEGGTDTASGPSEPVPNKVADVQPQGQYAFDEMKGEFTRLEGRVEDLERIQKQSAATGTSSSKDEVKKNEERIVELEKAQASMLEAIKKLQDGSAVAVDPSEAITRGKNQIEAGNFEGAIENLTAALKSAKGKKAEEATFLRGEAHFALKDYKKAIVDYSKFPEKFTHSSYMPKALYKIGLSFEALGMKDDAKGFYHELLEKYPKSPEAKKAKSKAK